MALDRKPSARLLFRTWSNRGAPRHARSRCWGARVSCDEAVSQRCELSIQERHGVDSRNGVSVRSFLLEHWPEYLSECFLICAYMILVCLLAVFLASPRSHAYALLSIPHMRAITRTSGIGLAAAVLIHTPWGKRSGGHLNPAVTLVFYYLGRVRFWDAFFYIVAHFAGASLGVLTTAQVLGKPFTTRPVSYALTVPGSAGALVALGTEAVASFILMSAILTFVGSPHGIRFTGVVVGFLTALLILVATPYSGASINPARSAASALPSLSWAHLWLYFPGPSHRHAGCCDTLCTTSPRVGLGMCKIATSMGCAMHSLRLRP